MQFKRDDLPTRAEGYGARAIPPKWSMERAEDSLSSGYWFGALPRPMKKQIIDYSEIVTVRGNSALYRIGEPVDGMYAALEGDLRAHIYGDDKERVFLRPFGPKSWFGDIHLLDGYAKRTFEVWAASPCTVLRLPKSGYDRIVASDPQYYREFVKLLCIHTRYLVRIAVEARSDAPTRAARALVRLAKTHGRNAENGVELAVNISQSDLASLVGVSRQYMNELIADWNSKGFLVWKVNAKPILLLDKLRTLLTPLDEWMPESEGWA